MPRKKKKPVSFENKAKKRQETLTNFYIQRLTQVCHDPKAVWELTKDPHNIFRPNEQELTDILAELNRRVIAGEIAPEIRHKIIEGINYQ